jgi:autotransporter-associated beta strand protein
MKFIPRSNHNRRFFYLTPAILLLINLNSSPIYGANDTWTGGGRDSFWQTGANWLSGLAPVASDSLLFGGTTRLIATNNFASGTTFNGMTFKDPSGAFILNGNSITLGGDITDNQVVTPETVNVAIALNTNRNVNVTNNAALTLGGIVSGGFGVTKNGGGLLTLGAANSFSTLSIFGGTVFVSSDSNLGATPGAFTPISIIISTATLRTTNSFTLNANRGIALSGLGSPGPHAIDVGGTATLTYGGIMTNNNLGIGSLTKLGFGGLTLFGANVYSGPTLIQDGTLTLDFTQATSPGTNIISSVSSLSLGGAPQGLNQTNVAALIMNGKAGTTNAQTFNNTTITLGPAVIQATNGAGGAVNLALKSLTHNAGGGLNLLTPSEFSAAAGNITTTATNVNGILGGWATISDGTTLFSMVRGTNFAAVDATGNIINYTNFTVWPSSGNLNGLVTASSNLLITNAGVAAVARVDNDNAGTTTDVNAIKFLNPITFDGIYIGPGNTLRLGRFGGVLKQDNSTPVITVGGVNANVQSGNGTSGSQGVGTLTAGGAPNTAGEIVCTCNASSESAGTMIFESTITDNGTGPVAFIKRGPGSIKLDGHNTFSGGLYIIEGRLQFAGSEIGTANPDGGGTGPIYILPGAYWFPSGVGTTIVNNPIFVAGLGDAGEPGIGAIRFGGAMTLSGTVTLLSDSRISSGNGGFANIAGQITGPFALDLGSTATISGNFGLSNPANDWSGTTTFNARNTSAINIVRNFASEVIPNGFGKGNVVMNGNTSTGTIQWDLNGFNETINGLSTTANNPSGCIIMNGGTSPSTLTMGDNDQSGTFGGTIQDFPGPLAVTKIGGGLITLAGTDAYSGQTTVSGGTLALSGLSATPNSADILVNNGALLDISALGGTFTPFGSLDLDSGTLLANHTLATPLFLNMTNGGLTLVADTGATNVVTTTLTTGGATNLINLITVAGVSAYPATFTIIQYSGSIGGAGFNFGLGSLPNTNTAGYLSNDTANAQIVLVLLNGPKPLTWTGNNATNPTLWDLGTTTNWLQFKGTVNEAPISFNTEDIVFFDDTAATNRANLTTGLIPGGVTVNNSVLNYTFFGAGGISGLSGLLKQGSGSLTLANTGVSDFKGGIAVQGGSVILATDNAIAGGATVSTGTFLQVGTNGGTGTLPAAGNIDNEGNLIFNRGANLTVPNIISGGGPLAKNDASVLTLSGANTFTGQVSVAAGTLKTGSGKALGTIDGNTVISSGATLDVNGQNLGAEQIVISGAGIGNAGAIINSGPDQQNALQIVTLTGNTTFGGSGRWDIRQVGTAQCSLDTGGQPYTLTKVSSNQVSLVGVAVDNALGNVNVSNGTFSVETSTSGLGDNTKTLTLTAGATLQVFNLGTILDKIYVLNGSGTNNTINSGSGANFIATTAGAMTLNGACLFNVAVAGTTPSLTISSPIGGSGSLTKLGAAPLVLQGLVNNTGTTIVSNGLLTVDGTLTAGPALRVTPGTTLAGNGLIGELVTVTNATLSPGNTNTIPTGTLTITNSLVLNNSTNIFQLNSATTVGGGVNSLIAITNNLTLAGTNWLQIIPINGMTVGTTYTLFTYGGTLTGGATNFAMLAPGGYGFHVLPLNTTPGLVQIRVDQAIGTNIWVGGSPSNPTAWDIGVTTNWFKNPPGNPSVFTNFDVANFDDTGLTNLVTLIGNLTNSGIAMTNNVLNYTFTGTGKLSGTAGLDKEGSGTLIIANSGTNDFTGPISISYDPLQGLGLLQVGNGGSNGNLGSGRITNNGVLVFNRSNNLTVPNIIFGGGSLTNSGTGVLSLSGGNGFTGEVAVLQGTLRVLNSTALGTTNGGTTVAAGATLDITNNADIGLELVTVSGAGVSNAGAIINSSGSATFIGRNLGNVTMTSDTTFGGSGRLDFRSTPVSSAGNATLNTGGNAYKLTKVGAGTLQIAGVTFDSAQGDIDVQAGGIGVQTMGGLGDPAHTLTVFTNATLNFFDQTNVISKNLVLNDGATVSSTSSDNLFGGSVALNGSNTFSITAASLSFSSTFGGGAVLVKTGGGRLTIPAIPASSIFDINTGTLDITGAGGTLSLGPGQLVRGNGTLWGSLAVGANATVSPGESVGTLTVTNAVGLGGTTLMQVDKATAAVSSQLRAGPSITYGGVLIVSNINLSRPLANGDSLKLFNAASYGGSFGSLTPATPALGFVWDTSHLAINGTLNVLSTVTNHPSVNHFGLSGNTVVFSGTNGIPNGQYYVLASTNVSLTISNWSRIATNYFDGSGNFSFSVTSTPALPHRFFTLQVP